MRISDFTDSIILNLLGESGDAIVGMPATELFKYHEDYSKIEDICRTQCFRNVQLLVRVKAEENPMGEMSLKYAVARS